MIARISPAARLGTLGLSLPPPPPPVANFLGAVSEGDLIFLSGQGPLDPVNGWKLGKVGADFTVAQAYDHARFAGLGLLSVLQQEIGSLARVRRVIKLLGMVNAIPEFAQHSQVIDGCSDLFRNVFGDAISPHARSAIGVASLPGNISVEIEAIVAID
jgi:enamine deaminase RidA (YjgF/YER057c/UK114 family)